MRKLGENMRVLALIAASLLFAAAGARAELKDGGKVLTGVSAGDILALYQELGFPVEQVEDTATQKTFFGKFNEKIPFFVGLAACETNGNCNVVIVFSLIGGPPASIDFTNTFNSGLSYGRAAVLSVDTRPSVVAHYHVVAGGVTRVSLAVQAALFLQLLDDYLSARATAEAGQRTTSLQIPQGSALGDIVASGTPAMMGGWEFTPKLRAIVKRDIAAGRVVRP